MNILCICPIGVGNYLMVYPACVRLKRALPDASLHLLGLRSYVADLAEGDPLWDAIHICDPTRLKRHPFKQCALLLSLRRRHFNASLSFFPSNKWQYALLPVLCGIPRRVGFRYHLRQRRGLSFLCTERLAVDPELHDYQQNIRLTEHFVHDTITPDTPVYPELYTAEDRAWAAEWFAGVSSNRFRVAVHPGSSVEHGMDAKRWSAERFASLCDKICEYLGAEAFLFGGPEEESIKATVKTRMAHAAHTVHPVSLRRTAALLSQCTVCLCNDSGIMHLASCAGVPTAAIFGPTDEKRNGPVGAVSLVIRKPMDGFPLWTAERVGDRSTPRGIAPDASLHALTVEDAWEQLLPWLEKNGVGA